MKGNKWMARQKAAITLMTAAATLAPTTLRAQTWTLRQCIDRAVEYNIGIQQKDRAVKRQLLALEDATNRRLPNLDAGVSQNFSFGRGLTSSNTYTNTSTGTTSFSLGTSVPVFTGMNIPNTIKLNKLNLEAATADLEKARNDVSMQVAQAYVQILFDMEIADMAHRNVAIDSMQTARMEALMAAGKVGEAEVAQQRAALGQSRLSETQAINNLKTSLLTLSQLLELPTAVGFSVAAPSVETISPEASFSVSPDVVFSEAIAVKPEVRAEQLRLSGTERSISIARSALYPQLSLSAGLGTNYYKTSGVPAEGFSEQLKNNFGQSIGINLNIPIFNRFQTRNSIRAAKIDRDIQQMQLDNVKKTLYKEIQQVCCNVDAAVSKYAGCKAAAESSDAAFRLTTAKYENGMANITEFNEAKFNWLKAESDLVQARYEYLYQRSLLDFYRGKPLDF